MCRNMTVNLKETEQIHVNKIISMSIRIKTTNKQALTMNKYEIKLWDPIMISFIGTHYLKDVLNFQTLSPASVGPS